MFQTTITKLAGHLASWYVSDNVSFQPSSLSAKATTEDIRPAKPSMAAMDRAEE